MKYFTDNFRSHRAVGLFERLSEKDPEIAVLLAKSYMGMSTSQVAQANVDEEIKAVKIIHQALQANPLSYPLLHSQVDFLLSKNKAQWARQVAQQAVNAAPSEFVTWAKLTQTYIDLGQYDAALLTLNSCPMFTFNERDLHRMPTPAKTHLPIKKFIADSGILDEESARDNEADIALLRLPAPGLRGTFAKAYSLLTLLVSKIGWDELLKTRSVVFVMEEEYRAHKHSASDVSVNTSEIPTIRISSESSRTPVPAAPEVGGFSNKRLCERWLDNLFLVLYEVSRPRPS